jgi:hypothetical protein
LEAPVGERGDAAEASERKETGVAAVGRKGKADGWDPPVSCPGWKGGGASRRVAAVGWAAVLGRLAWAGVREEKKGKGQLGSGCVGRGSWWPTRGVKS